MGLLRGGGAGKPEVLQIWQIGRIQALLAPPREHRGGSILRRPDPGAGVESAPADHGVTPAGRPACAASTQEWSADHSGPSTAPGVSLASRRSCAAQCGCWCPRWGRGDRPVRRDARLARRLGVHPAITGDGTRSPLPAPAGAQRGRGDGIRGRGLQDGLAPGGVRTYSARAPGVGPSVGPSGSSGVPVVGSLPGWGVGSAPVVGTQRRSLVSYR